MKLFNSNKNSFNDGLQSIKSFFIPLLKNKKIRKSFCIFTVSLYLLTSSFAWLYDEYVGQGALLSTGIISHNIIQYNDYGVQIDDDNEVQTILYSTNMSNISVGTKYIEVENTGTLDMEYLLDFNLEGTVDVAGILYYRIYDVTALVNATSKGDYDSKLEAYATENLPTNAMEVSTSLPIENMSLLNSLSLIDNIEAPTNNERSSRIYRFDYGMYQAVNTGLYSNKSVSIHLNAYSSQIGVITSENRTGQIWEVQNATQFREILNSVVSGDTIKLLDNVSIDGTINITKRVSIDLNGFDLDVTGDLIYEYANMGDLLIDVSGYSTLDIGGNFVLNVPNSYVTLRGSDNAYDISVAGYFSVNAVLDGDEDGCYFENIKIVKSSTGLVPVDVTVLSNTHITIGTDVILGTISAYPGSTNIEVVNNGYVTQLDFSAVSINNTFTKPQIYVYNLGEIYGVLGSYGIILPAEAEPYFKSSDGNTITGNTLIVKGITSGDITVGGSDNFDIGDIETNLSDASVVPIENEDNSYIVYIKSSVDSVENLLHEYFHRIGSSDENTDIASIKKLIVWTLNAQFFEPEDFTFVNSSAMPNLEYLSLFNAKVTDGTTNNRIPNNAFLNKATLKTVILPKTVTDIGDYAFSGVSLGQIPASTLDEFNFLTIPSTVTNIGTHAFDASTYIKFASSTPPQIGEGAFNSTSKLFIVNGSFDLYEQISTIDHSHLYISGNLSDDRRYIVFENNTGLGISYVVNNYVAGSSLGIPNTLLYKNISEPITEIGNNSYREMNIVNSEGVSLIIPETVTKIDAYAFYGLRVTNASFTNVLEIDKYAFYDTLISKVIANRASFIGAYAFYSSAVEKVQLNNVNRIEEYAFYQNSLLYEANVGTASFIGAYAFYDCPHMQRFYFNNANSLLVNNTEEIDLEVGENALFYNWGNYIDGRLRIYVPDVTLQSGKTVLSLYKSKFISHSNYIYINGTNIGSYRYIEVPYNLYTWTVKETEITKPNGTTVNGLEIISYQGPDLNANIPEKLTVDGEEINVISIGEGAFQNAQITSGSTVSIETNNLLKIAKNSLKNLNIDHVISNSLFAIGESAFENSGVHYAYFESLVTLGAKAFYNCDGLYRLKLGNVSSIGSEAVANNENLTSVFISNTNRNINYAENAFANSAINISNRFRMYVPDENNLVSFYKGLFPSVQDYIYPTGMIVGHYRYGSINFDIGEYSIRPITKTNASGESISNYEIIEYHGEDLNSSFTFPTSLVPTTNGIEIGYTISRVGTNDITVEARLRNISDEDITSWEVDIESLNGMYGESENDVTAINNTGSITFKNTNNLMGSIPAGTTKSVTFRIKTNTGVIDAINVLALRAVHTNTLNYNIISVGDNAFSHVASATGAAFNLESNSLLYIGKNAFANLEGVRHVTFNSVVTIDDNAFLNSTITKGSFVNLNLLGDNAFKNARNLYIINLGRVQTIGSEAITNAAHLYQVRFDAPRTVGLTVDENAFSNIGTSTSDRIRFYVTNGTAASGDEYVNIYKIHFKEEYRDYFYAYDNLVGSFIPSGIADTIDIGEYSVKEKTINGTRGYELVEYHGGAIDSGYVFPTMLDLSDLELRATAVPFDNPWQSGTNRTQKVRLTVYNDGATEYRSWRVVLDMPNSGTISFVSSYNNGANLNGNRVIITNANYNGTIPSGGSVSIELQITYSGDYLTTNVSSVKLNEAGNAELPVISIGDYAYKHSSFDGSAAYDINSTHLLYIGHSAFLNSTGIRNIDAPNCLTISDSAFQNAVNLVSAKFENLTTIGANAFQNDSKLIVLDIGNTNTIGANAFQNVSKIARLTIRNRNYSDASGKMAINIGTDAFSGFGTSAGSKLRIYVPSGNATSSLSITDAYKQTLPTTLSDYIYETGTVIGSSMYEGYDIGTFSVKKETVNGVLGWNVIEYHGPNVNGNFEIPDYLEIGDDMLNVVSIGNRAFILTQVESGYTWDLELPSTVIYVGDYAFYKRSISSVSGNRLVYVGKYAFAETSTLLNVTFNSLERAAEYSFYLNTNMTTVTLGNNVEELGDYAFYNERSYNNLSYVYINTATPPVIYENTFPPVRFWFWGLTATIYVPYGARSAYQSANYWSNYTILELRNLYQNTYIYEIINSSEVKIIGYIGTGNTRTIPDIFTINNTNYNVTRIEPDAFDDSTSLRKLTLGNNIKSVGNGFLQGNNSIREIGVNSSNPYFASDNGILWSKNKDTIIRFPNAKTVNRNEFVIPDGTKVIASKSFSNNTTIRTLTFNSDLVAISDSAFNNASSLSTINFTSTIPPYLTGFEFLPMNAGLTINFPLDSGTDNYTQSTYYALYSNYLMGS